MVKPISRIAGMFELVKPPVPSTSPRLNIGPNSCGCTATQLTLTFSAFAALSRIDAVSCTADAGAAGDLLAVEIGRLCECRRSCG